MTRTRQDILAELNTEADKYLELSEVQKNTSKVSFWKSIKDVFSFTMMSLERLFDNHLTEVNTIINSTEPGTDDWYKDLALKYQDGDTISIVNNLTVYPVIDDKKRLIKRVSIKEKSGGGIIMKVAKEGSNGLERLSDEQQNRFLVYMTRVKFAGIPIVVITLPADILEITATIELDKLLYQSNGKKVDGSDSVNAGMTKYLYNFPFDKAFYLSKFIDAVQGVEGVKDVYIATSKLGSIFFRRKMEDVPSGYIILSNKSNITYVLT